MMRGSRPILRAVLLAWGVCAASACRCSALPGEKVLAEAPGPPKAKLVWAHGVNGQGRLGGVSDYGELRVGDPVLALRFCESPKKAEIAVDPAGRRVAARCDDAKWRVVWIGKSHALFDLGEVDGDPRKSWSSMPMLPGASVAAVRANPSAIYGHLASVLAELDAMGAHDEEVDTLAALAEEELPGGDDTWVAAFAKLDPDHQRKLETAVCAGLDGEAVTSLGLVRRLRICPLGLEQSDMVFRTVEQMLHSVPALTGSKAEALDLGLVAVFRSDPARASSLACATLAELARRRPGPDAPTLGPEVAASIVAATKAPCGNAHTLEAAICDAECSGHTCGTADFGDAITKWQRALQGEALPRERPVGFPRAELAAVLTQGPLPSAIVTRSARTRYPLATDGPPCSSVKKRGEGCRCDVDAKTMTDAMCASDGQSATLVVGRCRLELDDKAHIVRHVTHVCAPTADFTAYCQSDEDCCEGLKCAMTSLTHHCEARRP